MSAATRRLSAFAVSSWRKASFARFFNSSCRCSRSLGTVAGFVSFYSALGNFVEPHSLSRDYSESIEYLKLALFGLADPSYEPRLSDESEVTLTSPNRRD
jgi:hypothetical protein